MRYSRAPGGITMSTGGWIAVAVAVALVLLAIAVYNRLVVLRNRFKNAFSQIDVQLKRRYDLIPNLVESVKGYLQHERQTLEAVTKARGDAVGAAQRAAAAPGDAAAMQGLAQADSLLAGAFGFSAAELLQATGTADERRAPKVSFT